MMGAKSGSPLGITKSHSTAPGWKLYKIMFTSHLEGDKNNKVIKSSYKIKVSRTVKRMVRFEELQDLRRLSDCALKGDRKFKLNKHEIYEKSVLVSCI